MATKYFCDLCDKEAERKSLLTTISVSEIEPEDARTLNRYDASQHSAKVSREICFSCRVSILAHMKTLGVKSGT